MEVGCDKVERHCCTQNWVTLQTESGIKLPKTNTIQSVFPFHCEASCSQHSQKKPRRGTDPERPHLRFQHTRQQSPCSTGLFIAQFCITAYPVQFTSSIFSNKTKELIFVKRSRWKAKEKCYLNSNNSDTETSC